MWEETSAAETLDPGTIRKKKERKKPPPPVTSLPVAPLVRSCSAQNRGSGNVSARTTTGQFGPPAGHATASSATGHTAASSEAAADSSAAVSTVCVQAATAN
ncbi:hypothetical protein PUN28_011841 [Cardiocondyla obscurior]|uniref:Uncharacterized protein n=1 Tax=Cardiocondyla obscurior TaxID=286306 RepID=A0AAW2FLD3_9HYME